MQTFILFGSLSLFAATCANAQSISLSSNAPPNPIIGTAYYFTASGSTPTPQGAVWGGVTIESGTWDYTTGLIVWESFYRDELFTPDAFTITIYNDFPDGTPRKLRAEGYFLQSSSSAISYYFSPVLGWYYPA